MMTDIRLDSIPFEIDDKRYELRVNMNVLADVQSEFGGILMPALNGKNTMRSVLAYLAAMLNDYADEQGWPERFTSRELGRRFGWKDFVLLPSNEILNMVSRAIIPDDEASGSKEGQQQGEAPKN